MGLTLMHRGSMRAGSTIEGAQGALGQEVRRHRTALLRGQQKVVCTGTQSPSCFQMRETLEGQAAW